MEDYLSALAARKYSPKSVSVYGEALRDFGSFLAGRGIEAPQEVTQAHIEQYCGQLWTRKLSASTVTIRLRAVRQLFRRLETSQCILLSPAEELPPVRDRRPLLPVPSEEEVALLLGRPDDATDVGVRDRALLETAYGTAARLQELARLRVGDLDLANSTVRLLGKGSIERVVPLGRESSRWLRRYLDEARPRLRDGRESAALWIGRCGGDLGYASVRTIFRHYAKGLRVPISPHGLRRACATHMLRHGAHPVQIQALLGHANLRNLSQYLRVTIREIQQTHARSRPGA